MPYFLSRTARSFCRTRIVLHKLVVIAALNLLPLLTWHYATIHFFENYNIDGRVKDTLQQEQSQGVKIFLWVAIWILVPTDIGLALWYLGQCQELLHLKEHFESEDDNNSTDTSKHKPTADGDVTQSLRYYRPLRILFSRPVQHNLSLLYDMTIMLVLAAHVSVFFSLLGPSKAICDAVDPDLYTLEKETHRLDKISDRDKCNRYIGNLSAAGYFSTGVAGLLAAVHLLTSLCHVVEAAYNCLYHGKGGEKGDWKGAPRDVDIRTREVGTSMSTGRLTAISEEEHSAGSGLLIRRRTNRSKSSEDHQSKASSSGSSRLEEVLLECLVE